LVDGFNTLISLASSCPPVIGESGGELESKQELPALVVDTVDSAREVVVRTMEEPPLAGP